MFSFASDWFCDCCGFRGEEFPENILQATANLKTVNIIPAIGELTEDFKAIYMTVNTALLLVGVDWLKNDSSSTVFPKQNRLRQRIFVQMFSKICLNSPT